MCKKCGKPTNVLVHISCHWVLFFDWLAEERPQKVVFAVVGSFKHYGGGIWKRRFHFANVSYVFRSHYIGKNWKLGNHRWFWIFFLSQTWAGKCRTLIVSSQVFFFKMFSVHTKTLSPCLLKFLRYQKSIEKLRFCDWLVWTEGQTEKNKALFSNSSDRLSDCVRGTLRPPHTSRFFVGWQKVFTCRLVRSDFRQVCDKIGGLLDDIWQC